MTKTQSVIVQSFTLEINSANATALKTKLQFFYLLILYIPVSLEGVVGTS